MDQRIFEDLQLSQVTDEAEYMPLFSVTDEEESSAGESFPEVLPVLPLKNTVLFPGIVIPITIGRDKSVRAVRKAHDGDKYIAVMSQKNDKSEDPIVDELYQTGTVAKILKLLKMPDGSITAIIQGRGRFRLIEMISDTPYLEAKIETAPHRKSEEDLEFEATLSSIKDLAEKIIKLSPQIPNEAIVMLKNIRQDVFLLSFIASNLGADVAQKQSLLEIEDLSAFADKVHELMHGELKLLELKDQIEMKVRGDIEKQQRDYFLSQQLKTIQEELGHNTHDEDLKGLIERAKKKQWHKQVKDVFDKEAQKLRRMNPQVAEYSVVLNYLELLLDLPWDTFTKDNFNLSRVHKQLDRDHYGLKDVKERILEHLAVLKLKGDMKAPIICLVGPPGVGKTSLGRSIATALKRNFIRMSLGGLHDESEIRGHRRTYIGAMPGRIMQSIKKAGSSNPVFILDEIDKVGKDFRGDPSSALLEVLDPEQNTTFHDNYLEVEYDLSKVLFIATANSLGTIQPALLDRMEIIEINGYSTEEKVEIAKQHLISKQLKDHGLKARDIAISEEVLTEMIERYTRESGVRSLDRQIASLMRSIAKKVAMKEKYKAKLTIEETHEILGPPRYSKEMYLEVQKPGVAIGLAWTRVGGDILFIEVSDSDGKGKLTLTGNLGDVMKESASTALSFIRAHADALNIPVARFGTTDIHVHVPEGAIPKDGPSAGITMLVALASALRKKPVKSFLAMTGEITLRGRVLPVGGIKEKVLAARRAGMREIMMSRENQKDVEQIDPTYIKDLNFIYVDRMEEVLDYALGVWSF
jgi:ATP-dependent Lon protease